VRAFIGFCRGLRNALRRRRLERDLEDEVAFHLLSRSDDLMRQGLAADEARRRARLEFGSVERYKDEHRDERTVRVLENVTRDLVHAWRSLRRSPTLVIVSALSLACGVAVNALLFGVLSSVLFGTPTAFEPERLAWVEPGNNNQFSYLNYRDLADSGIFTEVVGYRAVRLNVRAYNVTASADGLAVTANFFEALGLSTALGRAFAAHEAAAELQPRLAVLGDRFWKGRFQADPAVVGQYITINGEPFLVLGVLPADHRPLTTLVHPDVYIPVSSIVLPNLEDRRNANALNVLARLPAGRTPEQSRAAIIAFGQRLERLYPDENRGMGQPERTQVYGLRSRSPRENPLETFLVPATLTVLFALILLIGCANVAGLLLARSAGRQRELGIRSALGASRARLVQSLLAESYLIALLGVALGALLTGWAIPYLRTASIAGLPSVSLPIELDLKLAAYGFGLFLLTGTLCGILPALKATRLDVGALLRQGGGHGATGRLWLRHALVVGEVSAAAVLLVVTALLLRGLLRAATLDVGFDVDRGVVARIELDPNRYSRNALVLAATQIVERVEAVPGVASASVADIIPLGGSASATFVRVDGAGTDEPVRVMVNSVGPRYFETMGIPLLQGREFLASDREGTPPALIVNRAFAQATLGDQAVVGRTVRTDPTVSGAISGTIVGVVEDSAYRSIGEPPGPILHFAHAQRPVSSQYRPLTVHVRATASPASIFAAVREVVAAFDRDVTTRLMLLSEAAGVELRIRRVATTLLGTIGGLGLVLAMIGLYGILAFVVASRTSEIGIRMALGASGGRILREHVWQGMRLVMTGFGVGVAVSLILTQPLARFMVGLSPADPVAYASAALCLLLVALVASYLPARRATRVDPLTALRVQ
jgi:predicted permease